MEQIKTTGLFYLPDNKETKVPGILTFDIKTGTNIDLLGILSQPGSENLIIQGHTSDGKSLTLYRTFYTHYVFGLAGFATSKLYSRYLFTGLQFESLKDLYFRKIDVQFNLLTSWINIRKSFDIVFDRANRTTSITQKAVEYSDYILPDNVMLRIFFYSSSNFEGTPINKVIVSQQNSIEFKCQKRRNFEYLMDMVKHLQNFITVLTLKTIYPTDITIFFRIRGERVFREAGLFFPISHPKEYDLDKLHPEDFVVPFALIQDKFGRIIYRWFELKKELQPIISEFCSVYYTNRMFPEDQFLSITRCLESFHRTFRNPEKVSAYERYHDLYIEGRLTFYKILKIKSSKKFCENLRVIRNALTHNNYKTNKGSNKGLNLLQLTAKARIIFISALLRELGLENMEIQNLLTKSTTLQL